MELKEIFSIAGMGGLYKVASQTKSGFIMESLADGKKSPVSTTHRISSLGDISVFTASDDMPLAEVLKIMHAKTNGTISVDLKADNDTLKKYFKTIIENYDEQRVYASDIKKMLSWYLILKDKLDFETLGKEKDAEESATPALPGSEQDKPVHKAHESHSVKADQHAKVAPIKIRKKV
ncbi:MAG: DUF5606 domain-containing protein [Bacteroidia bacterium]|nr:DUF5606 domain-containing protein [Bacteroidia bacterium]